MDDVGWSRPLKTDCRKYIGDRPCLPHKQNGAVCESCGEYDPIETRLLIIKLGALGDVVRTAALIEPLRQMYPGLHVTWLTQPSSFEYLNAIGCIDRPLALTPENLEILRSEEFDVIASLDLSDEAAALAMNLKGATRLGFGRTPRGAIHAFDARGEKIVAMSHWDDLKKANRDTYQDLMCDVLGLPRGRYPIPCPAFEDASHTIDPVFGAFLRAAPRPWIGLNAGGGGRWQKKVWTVSGFAELTSKIRNELGGTPILFYGPDDREQAAQLLAACTVPPYDTGGSLSIPEFCAFLSRCDAVVTGDTLGLHLTLAAGARVVCLVGPTSAAELELYGQGQILQGTVDCLGCYLTTCNLNPDCMNTITVQSVMQAIQKELKR